MNKLLMIIIMGLSLPLLAMEPKGTQLAVCPKRNATYNKKLSPDVCPFCDDEVLKTNFIVKEDVPNDTRIILNKNPYCDTRRARHFVIMTIAHVMTLSDLTLIQLAQQVKAAHELSIKMADTCYTHEYFKNYGKKYAGQTVDHLHDQQIFFLQPPVSLPEQIKMQEQTPLLSMDDIFGLVKAELQLPKRIEPVLDKMACSPCCYNCWVKNSKDDDGNFIIERFEDNFICLPHFPELPGEVAIVPYQHAAGIQYLPFRVLHENRELAEQLLIWLKPYMKEIRDCDGGNIYTKSMGSKASAEDLKNYHVYTRIMPRTAIPLTPGFFDGNSCKLDYDPKHLVVYLKEKCSKYREMVRQRDAG